MKKRSFLAIGGVRRRQIVEAAVAIIAEKGLQHCSLSAIEQRAGMCRGQLTYYFPTKEEILLAVFDHLLELLHQRAQGSSQTGEPPAVPGWERLEYFLTLLLLEPPPAQEFHSLQYTFLSQIGHRADYRERLAELYEQWRVGMAMDCQAALTASPSPGRASARTVATLIQAILHGLAMQRAADPESYDPKEMLQLCLDLLGNYLQPNVGGAGVRQNSASSLSTNGSSPGPARRTPKAARA